MFKSELVITHQLTNTILDTILVGIFPTKRIAFNKAKKKGSEVEHNYTIYQNQDYLITELA